MSSPSFDNRRAQLVDYLWGVQAYYETGWRGMERPFTPQGERRHPLDDFFEVLTERFPLDGGGDTLGDQELALLLGVPTHELVEAIGGKWRRERNLETPDADRIWYFSGEPMQVLIGIGPEGLVVGTPTLNWRIVPVLAMDEEIAQLPLALSPQVAEAVTRAQEIRRAQFTLCRRCHRLTAPENGGSNCHGCMQQLDGIVF